MSGCCSALRGRESVVADDARRGNGRRIAAREATKIPGRAGIRGGEPGTRHRAGLGTGDHVDWSNGADAIRTGSGSRLPHLADVTSRSARSAALVILRRWPFCEARSLVTWPVAYRQGTSRSSAAGRSKIEKSSPRTQSWTPTPWPS